MLLKTLRFGEESNYIHFLVGVIAVMLQLE